MEYFKGEVLGRKVVFRDMVEEDVETIVRYWHESDSRFLQSLGADLSKLGSRDSTRERLRNSLGPPSQPSRAYFVIVTEGELLAYTNLNFRSECEACAHFHVLKHVARVKAIMYVLFPEVMKTFFSRFQLQRIEMQTLPENKSIDRLLRHFGLAPSSQFVESPDGFARAGDLNIWEVSRNSGIGRPQKEDESYRKA
jgi:RimJ/RimL family protein N-acetyltransferase